MVFPGLAIVIVNWNLKKDTIECIDSLLAAGAGLDQITLVDNGSDDDSMACFLERYGAEIHLVSNPQNLGFAGGVNTGLRPVLAGDAEWILLINNDTIVARDFLTHIYRAAQQSPAHAIIGPAIYYHDHPDQLWFLVDRPLGNTLITTNPFRHKPLPPGMPETIPAQFLNGCAMLVQRGVFEKVGLFDDSLFMYGEEVDFCLRARAAGYTMGCATQAAMWHKISSSSNRDKPTSRYMRIRNQIWVYRRYASGLHSGVLFIFSLFRCIRISVTDLATKQPGLLKPLLQGWTAGWFGPVPTRSPYRNR